MHGIFAAALEVEASYPWGNAITHCALGEVLNLLAEGLRNGMIGGFFLFLA